MLINANVGILFRPANINTQLARNAIGVGLVEAVFVKTVFRQSYYRYVVVVALALSHVRLQTSARGL
ncbi:hypothetical protein SBBP2_1320019 [Burkholderiales bacterium]|nr:hypothetical protein SBBP2_1320019 [Burkholderiales bacterium]